METGTDGQQSSRLKLLLILGIVLLIRLPFLTQAIQGDDIYYILGAQHALIDPAHPSHARYVFQGDMVDMRGHPHPPLNSWMLAALLRLAGDVHEPVFHLAYIVFSLIAAAAMWSLAKRWSPHPLPATLLLVAVPAFVVNGNTLEADVPFLAFWLAGIALFTAGRFAPAAVALALAAMTAYQAVVATPVLWVWCWWYARRSRQAWAVALTPVLVVGGYQLYERATSGALPATVLAGYFSTYGLQQIANKLKNAAALTAHTGWLVFPVAAVAAFRGRWPVAIAAAVGAAFADPHPLFWGSFAVGALVIASCVRKPDFLTAWVLLFFAASLALFFAGAARYLLPMATPVILLASQRLTARWLYGAFAANVALGLALALVNYQHAGGYRDFIRSIPDSRSSRVWVNGEWGLRFYAESDGALPIQTGTPLQAGEWVISSALGFPAPITAPLTLGAEQTIQPQLPFRIIGLHAKSGFSTAALGLRPFDIGSGPVDVVRAYVVRPRATDLEWLPMNSPRAEDSIVSGVYQLEGETRWMSGRALLVFKEPAAPKPVEVKLYLPPEANPPRVVTIFVDGAAVHRQTLREAGIHVVRTPPAKGAAVRIDIDRTFSAPGDGRTLGAVLMSAGFVSGNR